MHSALKNQTCRSMTAMVSTLIIPLLEKNKDQTYICNNRNSIRFFTTFVILSPCHVHHHMNIRLLSMLIKVPGCLPRDIINNRVSGLALSPGHAVWYGNSWWCSWQAQPPSSTVYSHTNLFKNPHLRGINWREKTGANKLWPTNTDWFASRGVNGW